MQKITAAAEWDTIALLRLKKQGIIITKYNRLKHVKSQPLSLYPAHGRAVYCL